MKGILIEKAKPIPADAELVMEWRNDPITLKNSFHQKPKIRDTFLTEFCNEYFKEFNLPPLFGLYRGERIGFLRFKPYSLTGVEGKAVDIGIIIAPEHRGKGMGINLIKAGVEWLFRDDYEVVVAEIKKDNIVSIKAFEKAGFTFHDEMIKKVIDTGDKVPIYRYIIQKKDTTKSSDLQFLSGERVFIIAEVGSNWRVGSEEKDLDMAKRLIEAGASAGADAIKFQVFRAEKVYVKNAGESGYLKERGIKKSISEIFKDLEMPYNMIPELASHCKKNGVEFMATPFSIKDAEAVEPFVEFHKNASYEISHLRLIEYLAKTRKPLIQSTGASTLEDIDWMVNYFFRCGGRRLALMQCTAKYPAPPEAVNIRVIPQLIKRYGLPVGLSDHSEHPVSAPVSAVSLGATIIEKHFTLDKNLPGPDHAFAVEPDELKEMVEAIRLCEKNLGEGDKHIHPEEDELYGFARRYIQATRDIKKGEEFIEGDNIDILRPGELPAGLHPTNIEEIHGRKATRDIKAGEGIRAGDYE
jgi:N-acetylneuraminate synthase